VTLKGDPVLVRFLWRQSDAARWEMLRPVPDLDPPPELHLTLNQQIDRPQRW